jgi:lysophospholipase L1-like esterase
MLPGQKIQASYTPAMGRSVICFGDSFTHNTTYGLRIAQQWPALLQVALKSLGGRAKVRNLAQNGARTVGMLYRVNLVYAYGIPDLAILFGGVNDVLTNQVTSITSSGTTATVTVAAANHFLTTGMQVTIAGAVETQFNGTFTMTVTGLKTFTYTFAGNSNNPATGTKTYTFPTTQTQANLVAMATAIKAAGCPRVLIVGATYLNFSSSYAAGSQRDTLAVEYTPWVDLRAKQAAAAAAGGSGVAFCDMRAYQRSRINGVEFSEGDFAWHTADGNMHNNAVGAAVIRDGILAAIQAQAGWLSALSA